MDPRALELVHFELDGRLDAAGRAELAALLAADATLRAHREDLGRLARTLAAAPAPELPAGFRDAVLRAVPSPAPRVVRARPPRRFWRAGLALAASVVVAVVMLRVVEQGPPGSPDQLVGTLAPVEPMVVAQPTATGQTLSFEVPAGPPGEIVIEFTGTGGRIVVRDVAPGRTTVQVAETGAFVATLVREGVAAPIGQRPTFPGAGGTSREH
jgi:hypothetical protein